jgi:hypothetical protein
MRHVPPLQKTPKGRQRAPPPGVVKNRRVTGRRVLQRQVLYLAELKNRQESAWLKTVELFGGDSSRPAQVALFEEYHLQPVSVEEEAPIVAIRLSRMRLSRPRQWGAYWLGCELWRRLGFDLFWR